MDRKEQSWRLPAEWEPHRACWLAWPSDASLWLDHLEPARREFVALCHALSATDGVGSAMAPETLELLVPDAEAETEARAALGQVRARFHHIPFGDIWLRDTAPLFVVGRDSGDVAAVRFRFNGWGGKYVLEDDAEVAEAIAVRAGHRTFANDWVLEGGAVEVDGRGSLLTTRQCLLNFNRGAGLNEADVEARLRGALGVSQIVWLERGLANDHTDGHIDTLARFVAPGRVVCMQARESNDPNAAALGEVAETLSGAVDAGGRRLEVVSLPSPGTVLADDGSLMPASFVNFYIGNATVVVPTYGTRYDAEAVDTIAACFPDRRVVGLSARAILHGGGAFHCITQPEPSAGGGDR